jgi:hypothetical protein
MLRVTIPAMEVYDENRNEFVVLKEQKLVLEHSLVSLSKWEAKTHKPFLTNEDKTIPEMIEYVKCMTLTQNVDPSVYNRLTNANLKEIGDYIQDPMTATWFSNKKTASHSREVVTSELIYYWMVALQIPFECQKWHLNRLFTLIRVCNEKNQKPKKMSKREMASQRTSLNAARRKAMHSKG